ncbi:MAG: MarR family transcriptional regulator [Candidatus Methanoperedens sp.]|nr:MarR family transcriptional regulator [Candidatus Methanoperedens sp.]
MNWKILHLVILFTIWISVANAEPDNYKVIYTIDVKENGSALWDVEYRTLLSTQDAVYSFENYSSQLNSKYLIEFKELMERSAQEASNGTSRKMDATDFKGEATIHSTPTGKFGVVHYNFTWNSFARNDQNISIGDAFVGGLYLSNDNTLIIRYPQDYTVQQIIPQPDKSTDELVWYGLRSFGKGEPRIILTKPSFPWITTAAAIIIIFSIVLGIFLVTRKKDADTEREVHETNIEIPEIEMMDLEDRILKLLKENGSALYQSEIGRQLGLPKSTVSSALNQLHDKNLIQKIRKGRENLIRMI